MSSIHSPRPGNDKLYHGAALGLSILCPLIALLPPRRFNLSTAGLGVSWVLAANYLVQERRIRPSTKPETIDRAGVADASRTLHEGTLADSHGSQSSKGILNSAASREEQPPKSRAQEYQDKLDEGASYGDIIKEQIWNVWNQGKDQED